MSVREEFDGWAAGKDRGMEDRHWHTQTRPRADAGRGGRRRPRSGHRLRLRAPRAPRAGIGRAYGLDGAPEMACNARSYTDDDAVGFLVGDFDALPFADDSLDHVFSMEAFYYATRHHTLEEIRRVLKPGGTFYCAVNYFAESEQTHAWQENIAIDMTLWSRAEYREAFREAGLYVAEQGRDPDDREIEIPDASAFPTDSWLPRGDGRSVPDVGTLLTVGVAPDSVGYL